MEPNFMPRFLSAPAKKKVSPYTRPPALGKKSSFCPATPPPNRKSPLVLEQRTCQGSSGKTNGYDFVYYNNLVKPAVVRLAWPWISCAPYARSRPSNSV